MKALTLAIVAVLGVTTAAVNQKPPVAEPLFDKFFAAETPADAEALADQFAPLDPEVVARRLKQGRTYLEEKRGEYLLRWKSKSGPFFNNLVDVPPDYDPAQKLMPRVQLHGGVGRPSPNTQVPGRQPAQQNGRTTNRIEGERQIYLHPSGWAAAQWWDEEQVDNILRSVDALKRKYNIDETRIYLTGISDGGTGVYYLALKEPNLWSSFLPLNGSLAVLRNSGNGADGELHGNNLVNAPLYIVNGENDQLYPVAQVEPHIAWLNTFDALVRDVAAFTLLLSPDAIDFGKPVVVTVNGKQVFSGTATKDPVVMARWAARDNDRTVLYGAELKVTVP